MSCVSTGETDVLSAKVSIGDVAVLSPAIGEVEAKVEAVVCEQSKDVAEISSAIGGSNSISPVPSAIEGGGSGLGADNSGDLSSAFETEHMQVVTLASTARDGDADLTQLDVSVDPGDTRATVDWDILVRLQDIDVREIVVSLSWQIQELRAQLLVSGDARREIEVRMCEDCRELRELVLDKVVSVKQRLCELGEKVLGIRAGAREQVPSA